MICNATLDSASWRQFGPQLDSFLAALPSAPAVAANWTPDYGMGDEGLTIPAQVNYVGKGADLYQLGYQLHGSVSVIARFLRTSWLWERVRVQGGAYGGSCGFDRHSGVFTFSSYRDPNLLKTLDVYDQSGDFVRKAAQSQTDLTRSIIGTIGDMDGYQLPDAKGYTSLVRYLLGETDETRQQFRYEVLGATAADLRAFADVLDRVRDAGTCVVLGGAAAVEAAAATRPGWLKVTKVL
jgi:Zn-dependent M16 (insulinase) family peptidase